jgi:hypothetical protein
MVEDLAKNTENSLKELKGVTQLQVKQVSMRPLESLQDWQQPCSLRGLMRPKTCVKDNMNLWHTPEEVFCAC